MYRTLRCFIVSAALLAVSQLIAADATSPGPADSPVSTGAPQTVRKITKTLKVYILAGQSNMQGKGGLVTIPRMALSPESKALHDKIVDETGKPRVHENVSIVYFTAGDFKKGEHRPLEVKQGLLSTGFGNAIGPELGFGITMGESTDEPILIVKTAWGGRSLYRNFRPPSAGVRPVEVTDKEWEDRVDAWKKAGTYDQEVEKLKKEMEEKDAGQYYDLMIKLVKDALTDPSKYCAAYDPKLGYEIAGFGWFQGYNDMVGPYPRSSQGGKDFSEYSRLLACLIRDLRKDLNAPKMRFVIGVIGIGGEKTPCTLRPAMAAPAAMPEFKGNVAAVETACFWDNEMEAALERISKAEALFETAKGWTVVGTPEHKDRIWHYTSFNLDAAKQYRDLEEGETGDTRTLVGETPAELKDWLNPDFDTSKWQKGNAPIGKGAWPNPKVKKKRTEKEEVPEEKQEKITRSPWGEGNMLLMKTTLTLDRTEIARFRLCLHSTGSYHVFLNGHKIKDYPWWDKDAGLHRYYFDAEYVKQGANELAFYGNMHENKEGQPSFNAVDLYLEGLPQASAAAIKEQQDAIASPRDRELAKGKSNQSYHYLGSVYTYSRIGEAMAKAMVDLEKRGK